MRDLTLVGFMGEIEGNEGDLVAMDPVVLTEDGYFVAQRPDWTENDLAPLPPQQFEFAHVLRQESQCPIEPGQIVWAAGRGFVSSVRSFHALREFALDLASTWRVYAQGVRWRLGTLRELNDQRAQAAQRLEVQLHNCLFDPLEKSHGDLKRTFELYLSVATDDSLGRLTNMGLYYFEQREWAKYEATSDRAVAFGLVSSERAFDLAVKHRREWLVQERLSEAPERRLRSVGAGPIIHSLASTHVRLSELVSGGAFDWREGPSVLSDDFKLIFSRRERVSPERDLEELLPPWSSIE